MRQNTLLLAALSLVAFVPDAPAQQTLDGLIARELPSLVAGYKTLHAAPELSRQEEHTSTFVAKELRSLGYEVTEHVGRYRDPAEKCYGVIAMTSAVLELLHK